MSVLLTLTQHSTGVFSRWNKARKNDGVQIGMAKTGPICKQHGCLQRKLELISKFFEVAESKSDTQMLTASHMMCGHQTENTASLTVDPQEMKPLGVNLTNRGSAC